MTQKRRKADSGKAIGETTALRWEPTHVTKPNPRVVPLQEGYDKIVEEILRRLEKNNLYVKPEKCVWKSRKIGFLDVIIGLN